MTAAATALRLTVPVFAERRTTLLVTTPAASASDASDALGSRKAVVSSNVSAAEGWVVARWLGEAGLPAWMLGERVSAGVSVAFGFAISRRLKGVVLGILGQSEGLEAALPQPWAP